MEEVKKKHMAHGDWEVTGDMQVRGVIRYLEVVEKARFKRFRIMYFSGI